MRVVSARARQFHRDHRICDMLGLNLNHPRFVLDDTDLTQRADDHFRGDFPKFQDWGINLVVAKGGVTLLTDEYRALWNQQPERHTQRDGESLFLSLAVPNATQVLLAELDRFLLNVERAPDQVHLVRTVADLDDANDASKVALLMAANRADWFGDSPGVLRQFARLGLRMITIGQATRELGWDPSNEVRSGGRLTELGVRMIAEMNQCGILIDLAHSNDPCALDVIDLSTRPVVDTHSCPRALRPGELRAIPDEVMRAMSKQGGLLGISPPISRPTGEAPYDTIDPTQMAETLKQLHYAVDVMGIEAVGIGTHFSTAIMPALTDALLDDGFAESD
ncbi:MAG: hypothetical protein HOE86_25760, partial [Gemmatimonadetes bacterium]|nr:hypothetical protein [Gemmatimonadota bacterium]